MTALTDADTEGMYSVSFSPLAQYYQLTYSGPEIPHQSVLSTTDPSFHLLLEDNPHLNTTLKKFDLPQHEYGTIKVDGYTLNYREIRPPNFDGSGATKYPILFHCYGGPGSQTVSKRYSVDWHSWLASEPRLEYITIEVDGRGTGFMGRKTRVGVRGKLGQLESYDQAAAARSSTPPTFLPTYTNNSMWKSKDYVNPEKVALWGWSYGGFLTLKTIESHPGAFPFAMAVAPVTDWRYYDSIYTERYMLTPSSNLEGYQTSSIRNTTALALAKRFFINHGTGDDNVHIQNSLALMDRLVVNGVRNWDSQVYTDDDHSIIFHGGNRAVYWRLAEWLERWFGRKDEGGHVWRVDGELLGFKDGVSGD
jgi:dipeptidyl aminopeptidase